MVPIGDLCWARVSRPRRLPDRGSPPGAGIGDPRSANWQGQGTLAQLARDEPAWRLDHQRMPQPRLCLNRQARGLKKHLGTWTN